MAALTLDLRYGHLTNECLMKTNDGLCALQPQRTQFVLNNLHQMSIVASIELYKHVIAACGDMAFHNLGNLGYFLHHTIEIRRLFQVDSHIGTCVIAYFFGIKDKL